MPPSQLPSASAASAAAATPSPTVRKAHSKHEIQPAPSGTDKGDVLVPGVCAWARIGNFPWWPTVVRRRSDVKSTLAPEEKLPVQTEKNRLVEFFNDDGLVDVVEVDDLIEYTQAMHLLELSSLDFEDVLKACKEADAFIRSSGHIFQRDAVGTAASKKARLRKNWYRSVKNKLMTTKKHATTRRRLSSPVVQSGNRLLPSSSLKCMTMKTDTVIRALSKPKKLKANEGVKARKRETNVGSTDTVLNRRRRLSSKSCFPPLSKRPRVEQSLNEQNANAPTPLKLFLSPTALSRSRTRRAHIFSLRNVELQHAHGGHVMQTGSGSSTGTLQDAEVGLLDAGLDAVEKMQKFTKGLDKFLVRKKKLEEDVKHLNKMKMTLKKDNKELSDMNELLKIVNEQQQNLSAHCEKTSRSMKEDIAALRMENEKLEREIAEQQSANGYLQEFFMEITDTCAFLRKQRQELRMEMQSKRCGN